MAKNYHSAADPVHSPKMTSPGRALAIAALFVFAGCAHLQPGGSTEDLDHTVDLYWKAVHVKDAVAAASFVYFDQRADWLRVRNKREKDLDVTSFDVQGEHMEPNGLAATVLMKATWYLLPSVTEETDVVEQRWVVKDGHWLLVSEKGGPLPFP
jgi:hypothetical protein